MFIGLKKSKTSYQQNQRESSQEDNLRALLNYKTFVNVSLIVIVKYFKECT